MLVGVFCSGDCAVILKCKSLKHNLLICVSRALTGARSMSMVVIGMDGSRVSMCACVCLSFTQTKCPYFCVNFSTLPLAHIHWILYTWTQLVIKPNSVNQSLCNFISQMLNRLSILWYFTTLNHKNESQLLTLSVTRQELGSETDANNLCVQLKKWIDTMSWHNPHWTVGDFIYSCEYQFPCISRRKLSHWVRFAALFCFNRWLCEHNQVFLLISNKLWLKTVC